MENKELLTIQKAIQLSTLSGGGLLSAEDAVKFITTLVDNSRILSMVRTEKMMSSTKNIDILNVAARQLRRHQEGIDPGFRAKISSKRNQLQAIKCMLPIEISEDIFDENIEKESFEDTVMALFTTQYGNDLADLAFNGDTAIAPGSVDEDFLKVNDGWIALAKTRSNPYDTNASADYIEIFDGMMRQMPNRFKANKALLRFLVSANDELAFRKQLSGRETDMGDAYLDKDRNASYMGVKVEPIEYIPDGTFMLSNPMNLVFGIEFGIKIKKDEDIFADTRQFAVTTKNDFEFEVDEAIVIGYDIP